MRRRDREVTDTEEFRAILDAGDIIHIGMHDGEQIYMLPMNYGYTFEGDTLVFYVHGGKEGKKWELIRQNPYVAFELDCDHQMSEGRKPCQYGYAYASIMGHGRAEILQEPAEKITGLEVLMKSLTGKDFAFDEGLASIVTVMKITVDSYTGKRRPAQRENH